MAHWKTEHHNGWWYTVSDERLPVSMIRLSQSHAETTAEILNRCDQAYELEHARG